MTRKHFSHLRDKMSPEARDRAEARAQAIVEDLRLSDLRRARELTQQQLAMKLSVNQAWISKVERQADMYVSTLRSYVEALGGTLEIVARFEDIALSVKQFDVGPTSAGDSIVDSKALGHVLGAADAPVAVDLWTADLASSHAAAGVGVRLWQPSSATRVANTSTPSRTPRRNTSSPTVAAA